MATLAQMRAAISGELGLDNTDSSDEQALIDRRLNEAQVDFLLQTGCKVQPGELTLTAGEKDYTLDTDVLLIKFAYIDGSSAAMTQVSPEELVEMRLAGDAALADSGPWYYALNGADLFEVYPTPSEAGTVVVYYVPRAADLAAVDDVPSTIPAEFHPALEFYALWRLASYSDDQSSAQGERYREAYEREVRKARRYVNTKGSVMLPRARVGTRLRRFVSSRNDVY